MITPIRYVLLILTILCCTAVQAQVSNALHFDGVDDVVLIADNNQLDFNNTGTYTLECWIKPDAFSALGGIISKYHSVGANGYFIRLSGTAPYTGVDFDGLTTGDVLSAGHWYHIAAVNNGGTRTLYINGVAQTLSGTAISVTPNADNLVLGADYLSSPRFFNGTIHEVRIWNVARTQTEIRQNMAQTVSATASGLIAYYTMDQGTANGNNTGLTQVTDHTLNANHGTTTNFALNGNTSNWVAGALIQPGTGNIIYVKEHATGNGSSWDSTVTLADALRWAQQNKDNNLWDASNPLKIYVAGGTYKPQYSPADDNFGNDAGRDNSFLLVNNVQLYGGFAGTETTLADRDLNLTANASILSGDIDGNDDAEGNNNDNNAFHVVISVGDVGIALLDGFTIRGGRAGGSTHSNDDITINGEDVLKAYGGGMYNLGSSPTLTNVIISGNTTHDHGGGMYNQLSSPTLTNVTISDNTTYEGNGGGMANYSFSSSPTLTNVTISNNTASGDGGGIYNYGSSPTLTNVTISGNTATNGGGITGGSPTLINVVISGNTATNGGGMSSFVSPSSPVLINVVISGNTATNGGGIYSGSYPGPTLTNVTISGNTASSGGGIYNYSSISSPLLRNSIIWGNKKTDNSADNIYINAGTITFAYSLAEGSTDTDNGNMDASGITATMLFTDAGNGDYTLKENSPVIAKGSNQLYWDAVNGGTPFSSPLSGSKGSDLAGNPRIYNYANGATIDIGAFEYQGMPPQSITFSALADKTVSDADFDLTATASSGLPVSYTSSDLTVASVTGNTVNLAGDGTTIITASQAGNGDYAAATEVQQTLKVNGTLPVTLIYFTAKAEGNYAQLQWQTANEVNNLQFTVYRKSGDGEFIKIGEVPTTYHSQPATYHFIDKQPLNGNNYYKLVQVDNDGTATELGIRQVTFNLQPLTFNLYPNPTNNEVNISYESGKYNNLTISDLSGKILQKLTLNLGGTSSVISFGNYPVGTYLLHLSGNGTTETRKVVKR